MIRTSRYERQTPKSERSWWRVPEADGANTALADELFVCAEELRAQCRGENMRDAIYEAIYNGRPLGSVEADPYGAAELRRLSQPSHADINLTQAKVDALTSRLGKKRPFPCISSDGADYSERQFAGDASKALRGKLKQQQIELEKPLVVRDALIRGTGCARVVIRGGDVVVERIPKAQVLVDGIDSMMSRPRNMLHVQYLNRDELIARFPEHTRDLEQAVEAHDNFIPFAYDSREHVLVVEAWHLPTFAGAEDGRHCIAIRGVTLLDEPYEPLRFPIARMHWVAPVSGFWGRGLVETLASVQQKLNQVARDIQEALHYGGQLTVFTPRGANINKNQLTARHPKVVETDGPIPTYVAPNPVSAQLIAFMGQLQQLMDDLSGLSRDYQNGSTSLGANASGKAMDTLYDIQSDRFAIAEMAYGMFMVGLGASLIDGAKQIAASDVPRKKWGAWIRGIKWDRVNLDDGSHELQLEPVNFLPDTRAGRLSTSMEMAKAGLISDPTQIIELFDEPDIKSANRELLGPRAAIGHMIDLIKRDDEPIDLAYPDPHMDLQSAMKRLVAEYNHARSEEAPEEIMARFRDVIGYTENLLAQASQGTPPPLSAQPGLSPPAPAPLPAAPALDPLAGLAPPPVPGVMQ